MDEAIVPVVPRHPLDEVVGKLPWKDEAARFSKKFDFKPKGGASFQFDSSAGPRVLVSVLPKDTAAFSYLTWARKVVANVKHTKAKKIAVDLRAVGGRDE